jgi:predicted GNAT family acetyltransferase
MTTPRSRRPPKEGAPAPANDPLPLEITNVPAARRYEARIEGELAGWVDYGQVRDRLVAIHTEVVPAFGGRGIGKALVRHVIADARARGFKITPRCPLFAAHFERNEQDADVLADPAGR